MAEGVPRVWDSSSADSRSMSGGTSIQTPEKYTTSRLSHGLDVCNERTPDSIASPALSELFDQSTVSSREATPLTNYAETKVAWGIGPIAESPLMIPRYRKDASESSFDDTESIFATPLELGEEWIRDKDELGVQSWVAHADDNGNYYQEVHSDGNAGQLASSAEADCHDLALQCTPPIAETQTVPRRRRSHADLIGTHSALLPPNDTQQNVPPLIPLGTAQCRSLDLEEGLCAQSDAHAEQTDRDEDSGRLNISQC
ncbi:hypothetical protein BKA67DRAFT_106746 [Truncatella angustata]|uniref:Uncharacterized protein n=1 Tax=Truncatella angustata TaxID=152316 RepID=A0A9P8RII6_9PEZI|nr:uncharacterized protein BKA67DRAFT_106746 [Truncatella angustata]KAH6646512.1 hypothetical protein BKA67DRAFT_106746 [Truncatella angustata]